MINRIFDRTFNFNCFKFDPIAINQTNALGSIGCSIELSICFKFDRSFDLITINRTNLLELIRCPIKYSICFKFDRSFDPIMIDGTNALGSIGCLIEPSISIVSSLINHLIIS